MTFKDLLRLVFSNLRRMKARVAMTATGVIIGTAAVVVLISLGAGLQRRATESLFGMGSLDELMVYSQAQRPMSENGRDNASNNTPALDDATLATFREMDGVLVVTPFLEVMLQGPLKFDRQEGWAQIYGVDMDALAQIVDVARGELGLYRGQVVLGASVAENFIPWEVREEAQQAGRTPEAPDLLDQTLQVTNYAFNENTMMPVESIVGRLQVSGILESQGYLYDYSIFMPLKEARRLNQQINQQLTGDSGGASIMGGPASPPSQASMGNGNRTGYQRVLVKAEDPNQALIVEQELRQMGFNVQSDRQQLEELNRFFMIFQAILGGIGAVALLVAAFGIANTMVMAIYERTAEIGLMKAIGATNQDVMSVFLAEAGGIGFLGGVGGVLLSIGISVVINVVGRAMLPQDLFGPTQGETVSLTAIPLWLPIFAITFATFIGVASGIYPAIRAAALSPIRALKYE
jgi:putative ABC transport system permease protein